MATVSASVGVGNTAAGNTSLTSDSVSPSGSNRAVFAIANSTGANATATRYGGSGGTLLTKIGADVNHTFGILFSNVWGAVASPSGSTTGYAAWGSGQPTNDAHFVFLEGVDQTTPWGTRQNSEGSGSSGAEVASLAFTGLTPGQRVVAGLGISEQFGGGTSSLTAGSGTTVLAFVQGVDDGGVEASGAILTGVADGSGAITLSATINEASANFVGWTMAGVPVNDAAGGATSILLKLIQYVGG